MERINAGSPPPSKQSSWEFIRQLDIFPKFDEEITIRNSIGGIVSLVIAFVACILFVIECYHYLHFDVTSEVSVDLSWRERLRINIDFTFPALTCNQFGIDIVDSAGDQTLEVLDSITKKHTSYWSQDNMDAKGCRATGYLETNKVKGEFHIAFGRKAEAIKDVDGHDTSQHVHRFSMLEIYTFNCSHVINRLSFGEDFPGAVQPLDGHSEIVPYGSGRFQYFVQIVPTRYIYSNGKELITNQYSVTQQNVIVDPTARTFQQPGIFFKYELSPYTVTYHEKHKSFGHFVTSLCAIIGGIYVVAGLSISLTNFLVQSVATSKKDPMGKALSL